MMVADNGSSWYISGAPDPDWDNDDLHELGTVKGTDFEVVDTSSLEPAPTSATVTAFSATRTRGGVAVHWKTASELGLLGYVVYRQVGHRRTAVGKMVAAKGSAPGGSYRFVERGVRTRPGVRYLLQVIHANGTQTWFGSVGIS
jgi:hypothetical protein